MKGIVFTEFLDLVETKFGAETLEQIIESSHLLTKGAYTTVGTYDHRELVSLVMQLSKSTGISPDVLIRTFGEHLFGRFVSGFPQFFEGVTSAFEFLSKIDGHIHVEVRKLYPDAELPQFQFRQLEPRQAEMIYSSSRHFADLAHGLIAGCASHYRESIQIQRQDLPAASGSAVRFLLTRCENSP